MSIFDRTSNLLSLYVEAQGKSEIPKAHHIWSFLSVLAATVADRVYLRKFAHKKLPPNLFVCLVGMSSAGKSNAADAAVDLVAHIPHVASSPMQLTGPALLKELARIQNGRIDGTQAKRGAKIFLYQDEIGADVGQGPFAQTFIAELTKLWEPKAVLIKSTVTNDRSVIRDYCINWLGCTTREWLIDVLNPKSVAAGPGRRICFIAPPLDMTLRVTRPVYLPERENVIEYLKAVLEELSTQTGEVVCDTDFLRLEDEWYQTRPAPEREEDYPQWKQLHDLTLKLAMLVLLCERPAELVLQERHWKTALTLAEDGQRAYTEIKEYASITHMNEHVHKLWDVICEHEPIPNAVAHRRSGLPMSKFQEAKATLFSMGRADQRRVGDITFLFTKEGGKKL